LARRIVADRHLVTAAGAFILALVVAGGALIALGVREPRPPAVAVVSVPPPADAPAAGGGVEAAAPDESAASGPPQPAAVATDEPSSAVTPAEPPAPPEPATGPALAPPTRLVVVATGIAWSDDLAAAAASRLPSTVAFALPADLPSAVDRMARWQAVGRRVAVRFDWRSGATAAADAVPLEARPAVQAARMEEQLGALAAATGAVVVEPHAADALATVAGRLAASRDAPVLLGSAAPAPPPRAWRLDPGLLGERGLEDALSSVVAGTAAGDTLVLLVEVYPALLDHLVRWLRGLEEHGIALVSLDTLGEDR
jgi:hypothetical protein